MADASYRYQQQSGPSTFFYSQQTHHPRNLTRNGSPVNSSRGPFTNDTPSPSRSPGSQTSSHLPLNMYNRGQLHAHSMMNGGGPQRFQNNGLNHKYPHQNHHQHHVQQNHHHQANNVGSVGHQHTFSSGTLPNATPHYSTNANHNGHQEGHLDLNGSYSPSWQQQIQLASESRQGAQHPHRHCKRPAAVRLLDRAADEASDESRTDDAKEERNRVSVTDVVRRQDWDALDFSGQGMKAIARPMFSQFTFLRKLYLDHNQLQHLDPAIGHLRLLTLLDISGNQIAEVPREIGTLVNLKSLTMFDNQLHELPLELGHLFKLEFLGVEGNPLSHYWKAMLSEHSTKSVITMIRDDAYGKHLPTAFARLVVYELTIFLSTGPTTAARMARVRTHPKSRLPLSAFL